MRLVLKHRIEDLDAQAIAKVHRGLEDSADWTLSDLPRRTDLEPEIILALFLCVEADRPGSLSVRIYHDCEPHPVEIRWFRDGMPRGTYRCPECENEVPASDLSLDISCRVDGSLTIVVTAQRDRWAGARAS